MVGRDSGVTWVYGLVDMQSFYASVEAASRPEFAGHRREDDDKTDPLLIVAGDPERRSGIVLAATPPAKAAGLSTAMNLGEALRMCPKAVVVKPRMRLYLETSVRIHYTIRQMFPLHEPFSVDEAFFALPYPSALFPDPIAASRRLKETIWDLFRIRCRVGLAPNKWMAKMANRAAKKEPSGVVWWTEKDVSSRLHSLSVYEMWGLKRRAEILDREFGATTIGDVAAIPEWRLRRRFGVWGTIIHRWSHGLDDSPIDPNAFAAPNKGFSHRITLPRDFSEREDIAVVILELLDEVCARLRSVRQKGRRVGLSLTYARFEGGFSRTKTLGRAFNAAEDFYPHVIQLLDRWWDGSGVRAVSVGVDLLEPESDTMQLSLFKDVAKRRRLSEVYDQVRARFGETSIMRAASLLPAGQLRDRSQKIGGHFM
ncbi:DNA polymerase IV [Kyrpidia spormannii]|uniref:DNA polymerase IV n=1 Tax=Kyrpidia spormannii TaxID=2055160 RepID=A0ACA8Z567_9BACL|nr:DNA polymerase IV [Kyrpidia spormannii]CAB3389507.1 DNA polymerase IV [Kyrpidia spormannii]